MQDKHPIVVRLEAQDDLRRELLRFCRFIKARGYVLTTQNFLAHVAGKQLAVLNEAFLEEMVEQALQADEIDWFERALQAGYAQESGRVVSKDTALAEILQDHSHEADALITDACYLLNMQGDGTLTEVETTKWRTRWLQAAGAYLTSSGSSPSWDEDWNEEMWNAFLKWQTDSEERLMGGAE